MKRKEMYANTGMRLLVRVPEIPTPRWTACDAKIFGVKLPTAVPASN